jgi:hypothetical protein
MAGENDLRVGLQGGAYLSAVNQPRRGMMTDSEKRHIIIPHVFTLSWTEAELTPMLFVVLARNDGAIETPEP